MVGFTLLVGCVSELPEGEPESLEAAEGKDDNPRPGLRPGVLVPLPADRVYNGQGNLSIPDDNVVGVTSVASVPDQLTVAAIKVEVDIAHSYVGDLVVILSHGGIERTLHNNEGGSTDDIRRTISVSGFEGAAANGSWSLRVSDNAAQDMGAIRSWRLHLSPQTGAIVDPNPIFPGDVQLGGVPIPDNNTTGITSTAMVPASVITGSVTVTVNISHTYRADLVVTLSHGAQTFSVHNATGGSLDNLMGSYPVIPFRDSPAGRWTLRVVDRAAHDLGSLVSWSITVSP